MRMRTIEISVGAFLLAGVLSLVFLAVRVSGVSLSGSTDSYTLMARFDEVAGLRTRSKATPMARTGGSIPSWLSLSARWGS